MWSKTAGAAFFTGLVLLAAGVAEAQNAGPPINPPGLLDNPGLSTASRVQSVPIPATTLILFGAGLLAMPWLRTRMPKR
jgi:hypothetical protein